MAWHAPVLVVAHSCVCSWYEQVKNSQIPVSLNEYKKRVSEGLRCAECVVAPSTAMLQSLYRNYGQIAPSTVIYNGNRKSDHTNVLKETFVLTCGRVWDEGKNIIALAKIASELQWTVYAAGEGAFEGREYDNFKLLGKLSSPALEALMVKAPVFVSPSKYEPFGLSILEAASCGCALVLGDIPSLKEIWQDAALFVNPDNHMEIRDTIEECISKSSLRKEYAQRAKLRSKSFTSEAMSEHYLRVYQSMIAKKLKMESVKLTESFS
jgi:glycosyltransferase involved in cell wall biosynthesis